MPACARAPLRTRLRARPSIAFGGAAIDATGRPAARAHAGRLPRGGCGTARRDRRSEVVPARRPQCAPSRACCACAQRSGRSRTYARCACTRRSLRPRTLKREVLDGVDLLFVRELTGGIYFGEKRRDAMSASDLCTYTVAEIERIVRVAAQLARARRSQAHLDRQGERARDLAPVARGRHRGRAPRNSPTWPSSTCWSTRPPCTSSAGPRDFDVLVTENMFGDILTDEASMLAGLPGTAALGVPGRRARRASTSPSTAPRRTSPAAASPIPTARSSACALLLAALPEA